MVWGNVDADCNSITSSSDFTYTATLMLGGKVLKQFAGPAFEPGIDPGRNRFKETLN
jgi:hypothetical protein